MKLFSRNCLSVSASRRRFLQLFSVIVISTQSNITENTRFSFIYFSFFPTSGYMNRRRLLLSTALLSYLLYGMALVSGGVRLKDHLDLTKPTTLSASSHRKMLLLSPGRKAEPRAEPERIGEKCKRSDIVVNQAATEPMPNGIPGYTVEITNQCMSGCKISRIHVSCGWFSSAKLINPRIFKRIHYNDCLVNNGKPLPYGTTLSFHYANTFPYPLSVAFVTCS